ncbi:hypothetical protein [Pseudomonas sp. UMAB-40]|uniref:hypothetical protein n=1 Tax=Pseudomonas sp. UMAB-40 TaxID=1365407 RepID=UPI001C58BA6A|nr:hypothetical protein [Pseudomonas sp. UMAB-40]
MSLIKIFVRFGKLFSLLSAKCFILFFSLEGTSAFADELQRNKCEVADFKFYVTLEDCKLLKSHGSKVVTFGVRLTDLRIVKAGIVEPTHMIVRIRPVSTPVLREQAGLKGIKPTSVSAGRNEYKLRDRTVYEFMGADDTPVYVSSGLMTYEGDRLFGNNIEVLYQFDGRRNDFETLDNLLLKLLRSIDLQ